MTLSFILLVQTIILKEDRPIESYSYIEDEHIFKPLQRPRNSEEFSTEFQKNMRF